MSMRNRVFDFFVRGVLRIINRNINIVLVTKDGNRTGKNFSIRTLGNGDGTTNRLVIQSTDINESVVNWLFIMDWATGNLDLAGYSNSAGVFVGANASPSAKKSGIYFNNSTNKFYKCEDGTNWINFYKTDSLDLSVDSLPTARQGGFVYLKTDGKYYKCTDGSNWVATNI